MRGLALAALAIAGSPAQGQTSEAKAPAAKATPAAKGEASDTTVARATGASPGANAGSSERTAVVAALDKRLGTTAEFTLKPGQRFTFGRLSGVLRTCERTQPFERKQSAAFVQLVEQAAAAEGRPAPKPVLVFSGWLFAESPSLNPVVHPVYDVWLKSCTMRFPGGPKPPSSSTGRKSPSAGKPKPGAATPAEPTPAAPAPAAPAAAAATPTA